MKSIITSVLLGLSVLLTFSSCDKSTVDKTPLSTEPIKIQLRGVEASMIESDQMFAFEFFAKVFNEELNEDDKNFMVSPFSLSMALAMTWNGSDGNTKLAIQNTLGMDDWLDDEVNKIGRASCRERV